MNKLLHALCVLLIVGTYAAAQTTNTDQPDAGCSQPPKSCEKPVKFLAEKDDCSCFACEYGNPKQHTVCTNNKDAKLNLLKLEKSNSEYFAVLPIQKFYGMIQWEGTTATLTEKSGKTWDILNPDFKLLKRYSGQNVQVKAHVDDNMTAIQLLSVDKSPKKDKEQF